MANLKTDYKDDIIDSTQNIRRKFRMITNDDGTFSFEDVTDYLQYGDSFGALDLNAITNAIMNECLKRTDVVDNTESTATDLPASANSVGEVKKLYKSLIYRKLVNVYADISANNVYIHTITLTEEEQQYGDYVIAVPYGTSQGNGMAIPVLCYKNVDVVKLTLYNPSNVAISSSLRQGYMLWFFKV